MIELDNFSMLWLHLFLTLLPLMVILKLVVEIFRAYNSFFGIFGAILGYFILEGITFLIVSNGFMLTRVKILRYLAKYKALFAEYGA